jgi:uncharacterized damage-inducible protein DinB
MHTDTQEITTTDTMDRERADLLQTLRVHRAFLLRTVRGLDDAQAGLRPTASALCLGGIVKHVALMESGWADFIVEGPDAIGAADETAYLEHENGFKMGGASLADLIALYEEVAQRTDELVTFLPSLDDGHPLPEAPWFESGAIWSARRVVLHVIAETAQHAGHADIIRETIDGSRTMG